MIPHKPLLADFHVHTTFSDGRHSLRDVIDFYGAHRFDVIGITDHVAEETSFIGQTSIWLQKVISPQSAKTYFGSLNEEIERAWDRYGLLVIPGLELSKNYLSNKRSAHVLALGVLEYLSADEDIPELCEKIRDAGGISIAAHPVHTKRFEKQTYHLWDHREELRSHFDAWEVASGDVLFDEVIQAGVPMIANSDLHTFRQMRSWKTLVFSEKKQEAVLDAIRKQHLDFTFYNYEWENSNVQSRRTA